MSSEPTSCPDCGAPLAASLAGLCARCVWGDSMAPDGSAGLIPGCELGPEIARGGMGIVYSARQLSPRRDVAVKMLRPHLLEQAAMKERFRQEAQAAAALQHPGILPVYQVGETDGVPWFTMMLAEGGTLSARRADYAGKWRESAALIAGLAQAVGHAHERGVLHRDLKPGNILFDADDRAYVCDFGLAKVATAGETTPDWTLSVQLLGTPHYLPPEVAAGTMKLATTSGDIYALGVILYELLTGRLPFDAENVPALLRKIADEDPSTPAVRSPVPKPPVARRSGTGLPPLPSGSTLIEARSAPAEKEVPAAAGSLQPVSADQRKTGEQSESMVEPKRRATGIPPDLAAIAMKCLEKSPARRYHTATALADDLEAWLLGKPVAARRLTRVQKLGRWARRNPAVAGLCCLLTASIATAFGVVAHKNRDLSSALDQRTLALRHSESISAFLTEAFRSPDPGRDGRNITVAETLDRAVSRVEREFRYQPAQRASLLATLGGTYAALGLHDKALPLLESVRDYHTAESAPDAPETIAALAGLADSCEETGRGGEALRLKQEVLALRGRAGEEHPDTLTAMQKLAVSLYSAGRPGEAAALMERVVPLRRRMLGAQHSGTFDAMTQLARCYENTDRAPEALRIREEVLAFYRQATPPDPSRTVWALTHLADSCEHSGRQEDALRLREEAVTLGREKIGPEHSDTLEAIDRLAATCFEAGQPEKALALRVEVRGLYEKAFGREHPATFSARHALAASHADAGRTEEALALWKEALPLLPRKFTGVPLMAGALQCWLGRIAEYAETCHLALTAAGATREPESADRAARLCCLWPGMDPQLMRQAMALARVALANGAGHRDEAWFHTTLGMALYRSGDFKAAEETLAIAERSAEKTPGSLPPVTGTARCFRSMALFQQGRPEEARALLDQAASAMKPLPAHPEQPLRSRATLDDLILWLAFAEARDVLRGGGTL